MPAGMGERKVCVNLNSGSSVAKLMGDFANGCTDKDMREFVEEMGNSTHRTLQQQFTKLVWMWLKFLATTAYGDARNEDSKEFAKRAMLNEDLPYPPFRLI